MSGEGSANRRPQRRAATIKKPSYKEEPAVDDDEDEVKVKLSQYLGDGDSSGSDFEAELIKDVIVRHKTPSSSEPSSAVDSDQVEDEAEVEEEKVSKKKVKAKSRAKPKLPQQVVKIPTEMPVPKTKLSPAAKLAKLRRENLSKVPPKNENSKQLEQFRSTILHKKSEHLNLSESSSGEESDSNEKSDDKSQEKSESSNVESEKPKIQQRKAVHLKAESESEEDGEIASQLVNLVTSYNQASEAMKHQVHQHLTSKNNSEHSHSFLTKPSTSLSSDSSDNEDHPLADKKTKSKIRPVSKCMKKEASEDDDAEMASQLENLAKFHSQGSALGGKDEPPKSSQKRSNHKKKRSTKSGTDCRSSIKNLLAMGEGIEIGESHSDDESSSNDDEKPQASQIPDGGIEISLDVPSHQKKKKKGFDVEAYLKREMARVQREIQLTVHRTHILCLVAHIRYLNCHITTNPRVANESAGVTLGVAMSVVPPIHATSPEKLNMVYLSAFVQWFRESFPVASSSSQKAINSDPSKKMFPSPLSKWLLQAFENYFCESKEQLILVFIAAARSIGWETRIVLNFETAPLKPGKSQGGESNSNEDSEESKDEKKDAKPKSGKTNEPKTKSSPDKKSSENKNKHKKKDIGTKEQEEKEKKALKRKSSDGEELVKRKKAKESSANESQKKSGPKCGKSTKKSDPKYEKSPKKSDPKDGRSPQISDSRKRKSTSGNRSKTEKHTIVENSSKNSLNLKKSESADASKKSRKSESHSEKPQTGKESSNRRKSEVATTSCRERRSPRNRTPTSDEELKKKSNSRKEDEKSKLSKQERSKQDKNAQVLKDKSVSPLKLSDRALREASKRLSVLGSRERPPLREGSPSDSEDDVPLKKSSSNKSTVAKQTSKKSVSDKSVTSSSISTKASDTRKSTSKSESIKTETRKSLEKPVKSESLKSVEKQVKTEIRKSFDTSRKPIKKEDSDSDFEAEIKKPRKSLSQDELPQKKITKAPPKSQGKTIQYWAEVLTPTHGWVTVDIFHGRVNCTAEMENLCSKPILYIIACNMDGTIKDLTKKYVSASTYLTQTRKQRVSQEWLDGFLIPLKPKSSPEDTIENERIEKHLQTAPMPTTVGGFKSHPLYVLRRHLLKFEAIYPEDAPTMGFIRGEGVYARECVHTLHCRITWLKEGRTVKLGEQPYKVVKARPKWDRMNGTVIKDQPLEVFGRWQTEIYVPPPAKDGKVPRNEYGNVELFKPWMLPKGTTHIPIVGINRVAKKLNIDCASAMIGWEFSGGSAHPVYDGFVVCSEFAEILMDAWNIDHEEKMKRDAEKKEKRVLDNWRKLIKGMLMHQKIRNKYLGKAEHH